MWGKTGKYSLPPFFISEEENVGYPHLKEMQISSSNNSLHIPFMLLQSTTPIVADVPYNLLYTTFLNRCAIYYWLKDDKWECNNRYKVSLSGIANMMFIRIICDLGKPEFIQKINESYSFYGVISCKNNVFCTKQRKGIRKE